MWLYYAHLYMSVLHCVFHVFHEHVITTSHTGYPHKYDGPWQFRIGSNQVSLVISYIFVDMITSYLTNLVITWRLYYIIYNICTCVYVYIYIYIYWPIIAYQHSLIGWSTPHLARPVPPRSGSSNTPRDSKGFPCQFASRDPADHPSTVLSKNRSLAKSWSVWFINGLWQWFIDGLWLVYQWFVNGLSMVDRWFINMVYQWFVTMVCQIVIVKFHELSMGVYQLSWWPLLSS